MSSNVPVTVWVEKRRQQKKRGIIASILSALWFSPSYRSWTSDTEKAFSLIHVKASVVCAMLAFLFRLCHEPVLPSGNLYGTQFDSFVKFTLKKICLARRRGIEGSTFRWRIWRRYGYPLLTLVFPQWEKVTFCLR